MTGPRVTGDYEYEEGDIHITTDSGQDFDITGDSADATADVIDAEQGAGEFDVAESDWDSHARGSFR
jgi:hypothetical protein